MKNNYKPDQCLFKQVFKIVIYCLLVSGFSCLYAGPVQLYHKAEGFYSQKKYDRALVYYQGAAESLSGGRQSKELKSSLKRIIDLSYKLGMTDIFYVYVRKYQKYWPEDILKQYVTPGAAAKAFSSSMKKDYTQVDAMGRIVKKIIPDVQDFESTGYVAKCMVYRPDEQPWEYRRVLRPSEKSAFNADPKGFIAFMVREASVNFAEHKGYLTESFGSENYKMLSISKVIVRITDVVNRKIVYETDDSDDEDIDTRGDTRD